MKNFKIWCMNKETKEGKKYVQYGIVREEGVAGLLPLVSFSDDCKKELIKGDVELPTKNGRYIVCVDETKLVRTKDGNARKPYFTLEPKLNKDGKFGAPHLWFLGSIVAITKIENEEKEDDSEKYAMPSSEDAENVFGE